MWLEQQMRPDSGVLVKSLFLGGIVPFWPKTLMYLIKDYN